MELSWFEDHHHQDEHFDKGGVAAVVVDEYVLLDWVLFLMMKMREWHGLFLLMLMMGMAHASVLLLLLLLRMRTTMIWGRGGTC